MHYACTLRMWDTRGLDRCLRLWPSIRIKVFIHLCVNKLGKFSLFGIHRCIAPGWKLPKIIGSINLNRVNDGEWEGHGQWDVHAVEKITAIGQWTGKEFSQKVIDRQRQQQTVLNGPRIWQRYHSINFNETHFQLMENERIYTSWVVALMERGGGGDYWRT